MPVLKIDPSTGKSLDISKTTEEIQAEAIAKPKKIRKPRKEKIVVEVKEAPVVKVNPFTAPNGEIVVEDLLAPLNDILKDSEELLQRLNKDFKLDEKANVTTKIQLPKKFEYKQGVTRVRSNGEDAFNLNPPSGITSLKYGDVFKDLYLDRIMLSPLDIKECLKYPDQAKEVFRDLIMDMYHNLMKTKSLDKKKKYCGSTVATLKRPGFGNEYCRNRDDQYIELRLYSDITELPSEE